MAIIESLSLDRRTTQAIERTLRAHRHFLDVTFDDARRRRDSGWRNAYVLDWELISRYMYESDQQPEQVAQLQFLLDEGGHEFLIGPGTLLEIAIRQRQVFGADLLEDLLTEPSELAEPDDDAVFDMMVRPISAVHQRLTESPHEITGFVRLEALLERKNVRFYSEVDGLPPLAEFDRAQFATVLENLSARRSRVAPITNIADAINLVAVLELRQLAVEASYSNFSFLLTTTRDLIAMDDEALSTSDSWGLTGLTRRPDEALYSDIVEANHVDAQSAMNYTNKFVIELANAEVWLRSTPALDAEILTDVFSKTEPRRSELIDHLSNLSRVLQDETLMEAQALLEAIAEIQRAHSSTNLAIDVQSASGVFDLARRISVLLQPHITDSVGSMFDMAVDRSIAYDRATLSVRYVSPALASRSAVPSTFLRYWTDSTSGVETYSWPARGQLGQTFDAIGAAYRHHGIGEMTAIVSTDHSLLPFEVQTPFTYGELLEALAEQDTSALSIDWIRFAAEPFDIQVETSEHLGHLGEIAVIGRDLDLAHIQDFYAASCRRLLLDEWVVSMFDDLRAKEW